jgi:chromosomal replication initiator protein
MQAWEKFITLQEAELGVETVKKWLKPLKLVHFDAGNLYLQATDSFQILWFEEHIRKKVQAALLNNNNRRIQVHISLEDEFAKKKKGTSKKPKAKTKDTVLTIQKFSINFDLLDPLCTFENFVGSATHPLPHKLLYQITGYDKERKMELASFNPIYLWGHTGTGKTHLLMATAHALREKGFKIAYVRAETFTEHVISAIRAGEMSLFRQSYRNTDVLIIDDVHLLAKKWATQEELFHTFNTLHLAGKQIMLSANCSPSELQFMEPRLISRFEWGIVLPMEQLSKEEVRKVLLIKSNAMQYAINQKAMDYLLETFNRSTKALCRALEALVLRSHMNQTSAHQNSTQISVAQLQHQLGDLIHEEQESLLTPPKIIQHVAEYFGIRTEDILGKVQSRDCVLPRQIAMHLCRSQLKMPFTKIGDLFSKDHSTVMSSVKVIQKGVDVSDLDVSEPLNAILKKLKMSNQ